MRVETIEEHHVEAERYEVAPAAADTINSALDAQRRVIAVGTTTTRTLEAVAAAGAGRIAAGSGTTDLFIHPGFAFRVIGGLLTNFHLPKSSLLMLVAAFAGRQRVLAAYAEAVKEQYRFYSYGDAMMTIDATSSSRTQTSEMPPSAAISPSRNLTPSRTMPAFNQNS